MPEIETYKTEESLLKKLRIPPGSRQVLIKTLARNVDARTPSGIWKITDTDWRENVHVDRWGEVIQAPKDPLPFAQLVPGQPPADKMPWRTNVQIKNGDLVWYDYLNSLNCVTYIDEEKSEYKLIDYENCYVATDKDANIIPLNGFTLFERVYKEQTGNFDIFEEHKIDRSRGIVKYVAKNNEAYELSSDEDPFDLQVGDEVKFGPVPEVMLEDEAHCHFDGGKMYRRAQARNISLVYRDGELILPKGRVLMSEVDPDEILPSGIILPSPEIKNQKGDILLSAINEIKEGDRVVYVKGSGIKYDHEGEACRIIQEHQILFVE